MAKKTKVSKSQVVRAELERLRRKGLLKPINVVKAATPVDSPLHGCFCWEDSVAAHRYRLTQAQELIRIQVDIIPNTDDRPRRVYVSLDMDKGGYRPMVDVMEQRPLREALVAQALAEYEAWGRKWQDLKELAAIFEAAENVVRATSAKAKK